MWKWSALFVVTCCFLSCGDSYEEFHSNGKLKLKCEHDLNGCSGAYTRYSEAGVVFERGFRIDGLLMGPRIGFFASGDTEYVASYRNGKLHGEMVEYYPGNRKRGQGEFRDGVRVGTVFTYYPSGQLQTAEQVPNDTATTSFVEYFENGVVKFSSLRRNGMAVYYERHDSSGSIIERFQ